MSMNANYRSISARLVEALSADSSLVNAVIYFDSGAGSGVSALPLALRDVITKLPPEMREKFVADFQSQLSQSGVGEVFSDLAADAGKRLSEAGLDESDVGDIMGIAKAWHGLHFLLAGTEWEPTAPPGNVVLGGKEIGEDLGVGPARVLSPGETATAALELENLTEDELNTRFNPNAFRAAKIYGGDWDDPEDREWVLEAFRKVRSYFGAASRAGQGMLLFTE